MGKGEGDRQDLSRPDVGRGLEDPEGVTCSFRKDVVLLLNRLRNFLIFSIQQLLEARHDCRRLAQEMNNREA